MRSGNNAAIVATIMGRAGDPPKLRPSDCNDQAIIIALAAGPPVFPPSSCGERWSGGILRQFASICVNFRQNAYVILPDYKVLT
jgi:hypothetical protein